MTEGLLVGHGPEDEQQVWSRLVSNLTEVPWGIARALDLSTQDAASIATLSWLRLVDRVDRLREEDEVAPFLAATAYRETTRLLHVRPIPRRRMSPSRAGRSTAEVRAGVGDSDPTVYLAYLRLPARCRLVLRVFAPRRLHYRQMSEALGIPVGSIGPTRRRCFEAFSQGLDRPGNEPG